MKYADFEVLMSAPRMKRYEKACKSDTRKALTIYRHNLRLSQEMFTVLSCFEVRTLLDWMSIDSSDLFYGLGHVEASARKIETIQKTL